MWCLLKRLKWKSPLRLVANRGALRLTADSGTARNLWRRKQGGHSTTATSPLAQTAPRCLQAGCYQSGQSRSLRRSPPRVRIHANSALSAGATQRLPHCCSKQKRVCALAAEIAGCRAPPQGPEPRRCVGNVAVRGSGGGLQRPLDRHLWPLYACSGSKHLVAALHFDLQ